MLVEERSVKIPLAFRIIGRDFEIGKISFFNSSKG
jgi:hypothetical protein